MSSIELWPLVETGAKIAMGGIMALGIVWMIEKRRFQRSSLHPNKRRLQLFEEISADVGRVNHCFAKYSSLVIESTRFGKTWPTVRKKELEKVNSDLVIEFRKLADAEAKLLMLGEKTMERTLRLYAAKIALFRKQVYVGRQDISDQEIADIKVSILELREKFYELLSRRYDKLLEA